MNCWILASFIHAKSGDSNYDTATKGLQARPAPTHKVLGTVCDSGKSLVGQGFSLAKFYANLKRMCISPLDSRTLAWRFVPAIDSMEKEDKFQEPQETVIINPSEASVFVYCQLKWYFNNLKKSKGGGVSSLNKKNQKIN